MRNKRIARPVVVEARGRATSAEALAGASGDSFEHAVVVCKRGRRCTIAKIVVAHPLGEPVLAMPYRHRRTVAHVSVPPAVLAHARRHGARFWVVRQDDLGACYALLLSEVERLGRLKLSRGAAEWFVPLTRFEPISWQTWAYVRCAVDLSARPSPTHRTAASPDASPLQLPLLAEVAR